MTALKKLKAYNAAPWDISFYARMRYVHEAVRSGRKLAVHFYERADTSTFRYRCYNVMQALKAHGAEWACVYFFENELDKFASILPFIRLPIVVRMHWSISLNNFIYTLRAMGKRIIYDVDDLIIDTEAIPFIANSNSMPISIDDWFSNVGRYQAAAGLADAFTTTNGYLGRALQNKFGKPYEIVVNSLNRQQIEISKKLAMEKSSKKSRRPFTIGYFSGTPSHQNDFNSIHAELMALMKKYTDIRLLVVGFMDFPSGMNELIAAGRVTTEPLVDFLELQRQIAQADVNIAPMIDNHFTNCKSELKFFEAAVVDTPTVATPVYTMNNCIVHGENGFLCRIGQWFATLENIYLGKADIPKIILNAKRDAIKAYSPENLAAQAAGAYNRIEEILRQ